MEAHFVADQTTNKLILLFVMDKMEMPLTEYSIIDIITNRNTWLSYMDCKDIMWQLIRAKFIYFDENTNYINESKYSITTEGKDCLSHFFSKIPLSIRNAITDFCRKNRMSFKRAQEYVSAYHKNSDGSYTIVLRINNSEDFQPIFKLQLKVDTRQIATTICKKWEEKAPSMYEKVLETLFE